MKGLFYTFFGGLLLFSSGCSTKKVAVGPYVYNRYPSPNECWLKLMDESTFSYGWVNPNICYMGAPNPISQGHYMVSHDSLILNFVRDKPFIYYRYNVSYVYPDSIAKIQVVETGSFDTIPGEIQKQKVLFTQYGKIYEFKTRSNYLHEFTRAYWDTVTAIPDLQKEIGRKLYFE